MTEEVMPQLVALSLSIAVLGAIWAYLALGPLSAFLLVWAGFIAWGCFFHTGGDQKALIKTICGNVYGIIVAWIALLIIVNAGLGGNAIGAAIVVGVTVFFLVIVAKIDQLSAVPANVYGYAATVAWAISAPSAAGATPDVMGSGPLFSLMAPSFANPLVILIVSMVLGAIFGYVSAQLASALGKKALA
jgi:Protein of unknown function (DUF1097)